MSSISHDLAPLAATRIVGLNARSSASGVGHLLRDKVVFLIVIAIAVVIVMGFMAAFFLYCQNRGAWPALDMPSFSGGGTWKLYCRK